MSAVLSFVINSVKFHYGSVEDAGVLYETFFVFINGSINKLMLKHNAYMSAPENDSSTINADQVFAELDDAVKGVELVL